MMTFPSHQKTTTDTGPLEWYCRSHGLGPWWRKASAEGVTSVGAATILPLSGPSCAHFYKIQTNFMTARKSPEGAPRRAAPACKPWRSLLTTGTPRRILGLQRPKGERFTSRKRVQGGGNRPLRIKILCEPGFPFWPSWSVYDSRLPAAMQRFSHCCQVRYSFRCRSGLRMLADHGVPAKPEGPLATPLPRRPSVTRVRWLFRAVDVTLRAQVAPKFAAACRRTTSGSDAPPQAATNNIARASRAVRPSSSADAASSSATSF